MKVHNNKTVWKRCSAPAPLLPLLTKVRKRREVYPRRGTPALLSLVFLCVLCASVVSPASAQTTITGTVKDASGTALSSGTIIFTLSQEGTVSDPALLVVQPVVTCTITNGVIGTCSLRGNDEISPAGTFYRVRIISTGGRTFLPERTYTITGATWDIGTATPLASDTIAAQAYQIVQDEGANLTQRQKLNFTGAGVNCVDNSTDARTDCAITGGGGGGSTHQIDGVALTAQDPINFLDTSEFDWTNPAAGNLSLALKAASVADSKLTSNYSGVGSCTNQFVRGVNGNAAPTCESIADADLPSTNALDTELHAQSHVLDGADHAVSGLTVGNYLRALTASTFGFSAILDGDLPASIARDSELHAQVHGAADHTGDVIPAANQNFGAFYSDFGEIAAPANPSAGVVRVYAKTGSGELCSRDSAGTENCMSTGAGGANHDILSTTHSDTTAGTVARGDLVVGQSATPSWQRLTLGTGGQVLRSDGTDALWATLAKGDLPAAIAYEDEANIFTVAGGLTMDNQLGLRLRELTANGTNYIEHRAVADAGAGNTTYTWPAPAAGFLRSDGSGTLSLTAAGGTGACAANQFETGDNDNAAPTCAQPAFSNLTGSATDGQVPDDITIATQDNNFSLLDDLDNTKVLAFQLSSITTGTTRTVTVPDANGEMSLLGQTIEDGELATDFISEIELDTEAELEAQLTDVTDVLTDAAGSCTNQVVTAVNDGAAPTCSNVTSAMISDGVVASADLATANKTFKCNFVLFDDSGLKDTDDIPSISNCSRPGRAITITEVHCECDAGSPVINLQRDDGTPADILSSNLTCTTGGANGTIAGAEDNIAATDKIDFVAVSGMSGANRISILIEYTVD